MADSSLGTFERNIIDSVVFRVLGKFPVNFQFAPRVVNDSNSSSWEEQDIWAIELLRIHKGSVGRRITMEWEYISSDNVFTPQRIFSELNALKSYFYEFKRDEYPVVVIQYPTIIPVKTNFRLRDVNVTHGPELFGSGAGAFPLYTKVSAQLELATAGGNIQSGGGNNSGYKIDVRPVNIKVQPEWY